MEYEAKTEGRVNGNIFFSKMRCIRCPECGEEILMVPTLGKMIEAIENHIGTHRKQRTNRTEFTLEPTSIRTTLTEQVLEQASRLNGISLKPSPWFPQQ